MKEKVKAKKVEFRNTRVFIGDIIRMCQIKRVGRRHHYYSAKVKLENGLNKLRNRRQENEKQKKGREARER